MSRTRVLAPPLTLFLAAGVASASLPPPVVDTEGVAVHRVVLPGHLPAPVREGSATPLPRTASPTDEALTVTLVLRREDQAGFEAHLAAIRDPASPNWRRFLSQREIADRFGPSASSFEEVARWLRSAGLEIVESPANRLTLSARGSRAEVEAAFGVSLREWSAGPRTFRAPASEPTLPAHLASKVQAVTGLDDLARPRPMGQAIGKAAGAVFSWLKKLATPQVAGTLNQAASASSTGSSANGTYDPPTGWLANDGAGETVGVTAFDTFSLQDVADYLALMGMPAEILSRVSRVTVGGGATPGPDQAEVLLDVTAILSVAPGAGVVVYEGPFTGRDTSFQRLFNRMLDDGVDIVSNSWAYCEDQTTSADVESLESIFQAAAMAGVTVLNASGDTGSACLNGSPGTVAVPASAPSATAVGGTTLDSGPVFLHEDERWWDGSADTPPTGQGGFGTSRFFARPSWQDGFTASSKRSVPDVSVNADPARGVFLCQADDGGCPNGRLYGGTSIAAPIWAGFVAILNEAGGGNLGALNPLLYPLAATDAFHDAASMGSDFAHVGLGSPNLNALHLLLEGKTPGLPDPSQTEVGHALPVPGYLIPPIDAEERPMPVPADGATEAFVLVRLRDADGNTVPGRTVSLAASGGSATIEPASAVSSVGNGAAVFRVTDLVAETLTFTATDTATGTVVGTTPPVSFVVPPAASAGIGAGPPEVNADGVSAAAVVVLLQDALGRPAPGKVVTLLQGDGHSAVTAPDPRVTGADGSITFQVRNLVSETVTYTAVNVTDGDLAVPGSATVTFVNGSVSACGSGAAPTAGDGFVLEPYATGFAAGPLFFGNVNFPACSGANEPAFLGDAAYVSNFREGRLYRLPRDGGAASSDTALAIAGPTLSAAVAGRDGRLYATRAATTGDFTTGAIVELDPDSGDVLRTVASGLRCPASLVADPASGDLFVNGGCFGAGSDDARILRVRDPGDDTPVVETWATLPATPNGRMSFSPDGSLYVLTGYLDASAPVYRVSVESAPAAVELVPSLESNYWLNVVRADEAGRGEAFLTLKEDGSELRITDLSTDPPTHTVVARGIGGGVVGPDGCLYAVASGTTVYRIRDEDGGCSFLREAAAPSLTLDPLDVVPEPSQGTPLEFTATLRGANAAEGTPVFLESSGANPFLRMARTDATGRATWTVTGILAGEDVLVATAATGDTTLVSNDVRVDWAEGRHTTEVSLNLSPTAGLPSEAFAARALLLDLSAETPEPVEGATIEFTLDGDDCSATTDADGEASCDLTPGGTGISTLAAAFAGDDERLPAASSRAFTVAGEDVSPTTTLPGGQCADPVANGTVTAADALFVLRTAVGSETCEACVCDANGSGTTTAVDALLVLRVAVGLDDPLACPACP